MNTNDDIAQDEAVAWFQRLMHETAWAQDWTEFEAWLQASEQNGRAYRRLELLSLDIEDERDALRVGLNTAWTQPAPASVITHLQASKRSKRRWWPAVALGGAAAAAAGAALIVLAPPGWMWTSKSSKRAAEPVLTLATAPARPQLVRLADGTSVTLNGGSILKVAWTAGVRRVVLDQGEATFDVAHIPGRPFQVQAGDRLVTVVGTEFNVVHDAGQVRVAVRRGVVRVGAPGQEASATQLRAGDRLTHAEGEPKDRLQKAEPQDAVAWRQGYRVYEDEPLSSVARDLSRSFEAPILTTEEAGRLRFSGVLKLDSEDAVVRRLEVYAPVKARRQAGRILLQSSGSDPVR